MELEFLDINVSKGKPKATIHKSGKLGFNNEAIQYMDLNKKPMYKLAKAGDNEYLYLLEVQDDKGAAKVSKAGNYFYLNVGDAFDRLELDYRNNTVIFDIKKETYKDQNLYSLSKRILPRNKK
jgi:hypothetical protein